MLAISVSLLSGTCLALDVEPNCTITELKAELEEIHPVPPMHEMKLMQMAPDSRELNDGDQITTEVQAVIVPSPARILSAIEDFLTRVELMGYTNYKHYDIEDFLDEFESLDRSDDTTESLMAAFALLGTCPNVPEAIFEQLPARILSAIDDLLYELDRANRSDDTAECLMAACALLDTCPNVPEAIFEDLLTMIMTRGRIDIDFCEIVDMPSVRLGLARLGSAFGRSCGDPEPYIDDLCAVFGDGDDTYFDDFCMTYVAVHAIIEIAKRCKPLPPSLLRHAQTIIFILQELVDMMNLDGVAICEECQRVIELLELDGTR